ncbi:MAG: lipid-A-disaccharide synthase [Variovorax sp.]
MNAPAFGMVAGEASGDLLAGLLLDGLRARWPHLTAGGIGGAAMQQRGFDAWWPSERLAVSGYSLEVLRRVRELVAMRGQLRERLLRAPPAAFIGVDAPDFNLALEASLRRRGVKTLHFVCPSIWAWRAKRVDKIRAAADHVLCVFPFEPALLQGHGISASYVGHPLANIIAREPDRAAARMALGLPVDATVVALLPGSRQGEIAQMAPRFLAAAALMQRARPGLQFVLPVLPPRRAQVEQHLMANGGAHGLTLLDGQSHLALAACNVALVASGTATLETALFKRPMVVAYAVHPIAYQILRRRHLQEWIGLPNILCGELVVPELVQSAATPAALAEATLAWLDQPEKAAALERRFHALHEQLQRDTSSLCADAVEKVIRA